MLSNVEIPVWSWHLTGDRDLSPIVSPGPLLYSGEQWKFRTYVTVTVSTKSFYIIMSAAVQRSAQHLTAVSPDFWNPTQILRNKPKSQLWNESRRRLPRSAPGLSDKRRTSERSRCKQTTFGTIAVTVVGNRKPGSQPLSQDANGKRERHSFKRRRS
mgnify:CR=1 FL=1